MSVGRFVAVLAAALLVGIGLGAMLFRLLDTPSVPTSTSQMLRFDNLLLDVPDSYLRTPGQQEGASTRLNLVMVHPDMRARRPERRVQPGAGAPDNEDDLLFVAITRGDGAPDPADRPQDLYAHFVEPDAWQNPGGLVMRRFRAGSPYADQELYVVPPDGRAFTALCRKGETEVRALGEACLWRFRLQGADIEVRFSPALLPSWEVLSTGVRQRIEGWRPG